MQYAHRPSEGADTISSRSCGDCGRIMTLSVALPRLSALPALQNYRCTTCGNVELDVLEHFGPCPASATAGQPRS